MNSAYAEYQTVKICNFSVPYVVIENVDEDEVSKGSVLVPKGGAQVT